MSKVLLVLKTYDMHCILIFEEMYVEGFVQERRNSIANALELHLSCTNPSM